MIKSISIDVVENGYVVTCYSDSENGMYVEPRKHIGQSADAVKKLVGEFLKSGAEGCEKKEK